MHLLCLDEDEKFCQIIETEAHALGIKITVASSLKAVTAQTPDFTASILSSINLCHRTIFKGHSVSLAYPTLPLPSELEALKRNHHIDFVVGKPLGTQEARYLITKACKLPNPIEPSCDWLMDIPFDLMQQYLRLAYQKLTTVSEIIQQLQINPSRESWHDLEQSVHKIAGSAGMYGRTLASDICKKLEIELKNKNHSNLDLTTFYRQLYLYVQ